MSRAPLLELNGIAKAFPISKGRSVRAVDGVSIALHAGETLGIVGESGCGKSTLARIALHLISPTVGTIRYRGKELTGHKRRQLLEFRRNVQAVFQNPYASLNGKMTIREILTEPLRIHRIIPDQPIDEWLEELLSSIGVNPGDLDKRPAQFSGGQLQRIAIARALALDPDIVVADEPTSALDPSIQAQIVNLFLGIQQRRNLALMVISHDLDVVGHMSDRIAVMYLGQVVETGPTHSLMAEPLHPYTQALLSASPSPAARRSGKWERIVLKGDLPSPSNIPPGCRFHPRCPRATAHCLTTPPEVKSYGTAGHTVACHLAPEDTLGTGRAVAAARQAETA